MTFGYPSVAARERQKEDIEMKNIVLTLLSALTALFLVACGGGSVCEDAADIQLSAIEDYCGMNTDCAACTCINDPDAEGCETDGGDGGDAECTGDAETAAQACVDDEDACATAASAGFEAICSI